MSQNDDNTKTGSDEISNVDLQFMGRTDDKRERDAAIDAESKTVSPGKAGLDKQDVVVAQSMDASDPPSTNMGGEDQ